MSKLTHNVQMCRKDASALLRMRDVLYTQKQQLDTMLQEGEDTLLYALPGVEGEAYTNDAYEAMRALQHTMSSMLHLLPVASRQLCVHSGRLQEATDKLNTR